MSTENTLEQNDKKIVYTPKKIERDELGLVRGLNYIFDESGKVIWRKLIKNEFLVPNKDKTEATDVSQIEDKDLLILLGGIKELADIRGYKSVSYKVISASQDYCCVVCKILWQPNYETEFQEIEFESIADASFNNTESFAKLYLASIAENRAFVRCVRNFLRINIVGKDEVGVTKNNKKILNEDKQVSLLEKLMEKKKIQFIPHIQEKLQKENKWKEEYKSIKDLPKDIIFELLDRIKKYNPNTTEIKQ